MPKIMVVAIREYNAAVRTKAFVVSVVLMPILMGGGIIAIKLFENQVDTTDKKLAVIDHTGQIAPGLVAAAASYNENEVIDEAGNKIKPRYELVVVEPTMGGTEDQLLDLSDQVREKQLYGFLAIGADVIDVPESADGLPSTARIRYYADNAALDEMRRWLSGPINQRIREQRFRAAGLDQQLVGRLTRQMRVEPLGLVSRDATTGAVKGAERSNEAEAILVPMAMMMIMFMLIIMGAQPLMQSVLEEKMQRIAEVLLGSVRPFELMMGKLLGTIGVSFTIVAVYVAGGLLVAQRLDVMDRVPVDNLPWFFAYQVAAIFMFGAMFIAIGAACNDLREAQSLMMPVMVLVIVPMMVWFPVVKEPLSKLATYLSLIPPFTPMLMLMRQSSPASIPAWQPYVGLAGVILFTALSVWAAGRVFRVGLLMQGKPPKLTDLARWAIRG